MIRLRLCAVCHGLILDGRGARCAECRRLWSRGYDATRPEHHRVYQSPAWRKLAAEVRASAVRCHWCLKVTRRLVADHRIPLAERPDLALERSNVVPSCYGCNSRRARGARLMPVDDGWPVLDSPATLARLDRYAGTTQAPEPATAAGAVPFGSGRSEPREAGPTFPAAQEKAA